MTRMYRLMLLAARSRRAQLLTALRASVLGSVAQAAAYVVLIGLIAELAGPHPDSRTAWSWFGGFLLFYAVEAAMRLRELAFQYTDWARTTSDTRLALGEKMRSMPLRELEKRSAGDLSAVVGGNVTTAAMSVSQVAFMFLQAAIVPTLVTASILVIDWRVGLVLLCALPAAIPFVRGLQSRSNSSFREANQADALASSRIVEYVQGLPVLRATGRVGRESARLDDALRAQSETMSRGQRSLTLPSIAADVAMQIGVILAVALGAALVFDANLSAPLLAALAVAALKMSEPLTNAMSMLAVFELSEAALKRIGDLMDVQSLPVRKAGTRLRRFDIEFDGVTFGYTGKPVLKNVALKIPERSMTALVGPSGSGKTTLTKLITRYDDPTSGTVRIGGVDLRDVEPTEIYRHVSVVFQDVYLFDDTIRANIAMARPGASDAEVEAAARAAHVHEFVTRLPQGYDTVVGEIGGRLSGGERQRVSIARAILKDAPIVLLDEPTAALDSLSELAVQRAIDALVRDKTVIVIAHRLSTVVAADQIAVVDAGAVVECGTHSELLVARGRYADMWNAHTRARPSTAGAPRK
ncbi:MAG: ABC transporter ATP-binding protein [Rhodococcus sp. (in: high G+C Gram-positive bacteria)]|uniref:ABC transporter ATP-binding protein n=1 Tax=Rhodococcus sp. TaxID=1831 RepID=UPI002ADBC8AD|nr:ABC transporter ATP-binding protein [Rhodococcus sp. (in: high G+C Gram-positive bacteria)]MDZ7930248.1 ABC transporter ATP-binding protein [Rhodococcus sp. (in: high G+C Gram-positive bacteria)]